MKVTQEISLFDFEAWSGAKNTMEHLNNRECEVIEQAIEETYPDGIDATQLNDILWFETDWIAELLGYDSWEEKLNDE